MAVWSPPKPAALPLQHCVSLSHWHATVIPHAYATPIHTYTSAFWWWDHLTILSCPLLAALMGKMSLYIPHAQDNTAPFMATSPVRAGF